MDWTGFPALAPAQMKEQIRHMVLAGGGVSFVQIRDLPGGSGEMCIHDESRNLVYWGGLSEAAAAAVMALRAEGTIMFYPTTPLVYVADGFVPTMPPANDAAAILRGYKEPHWVPVVLVPGIRAA